VGRTNDIRCMVHSHMEAEGPHLTSRSRGENGVIKKTGVDENRERIEESTTWESWHCQGLAKCGQER